MARKPRKSMSNIVQFLDKLDQDCIKNQEALIDLAKKINPFHEVDWNAPKWNVTESVQHKIRGHETRKTKYLNYFRNVPNQSMALDGHFADVIKAMTTLRFHRGGQGAPNLQRFIDGWRYIYDAFDTDERQIQYVTPEILNRACRQASNRLAENTAYNVHKSIHEIADLLDKNKLVKVYLGFRYVGAKRPQNTSGVGYVRLDDPNSLETSNKKMADESVLEALGILYQKIPKQALADRVRILLVTLAIFLGRRIGEILTMPLQVVQCNENGTHYVTSYPQKWSQGDLELKEERIPLPTASIELIKAVIDELGELTLAMRTVAEYIYKHGHADYSLLREYEAQGWMTARDIERCFGISKGNGQAWARNRKLVAQPRPNRKRSSLICWSLDQIKLGMDSDLDLRPMLVAANRKLFHKDCLAILPLNACQSEKRTFEYAVRLVDWQQISDFLGSGTTRRKGGENYAKKGKVLSAFDRYLDGEEGERLAVNSHAFRHTLNTWLDEGGMSDAAQTRWFNRKNPRDTKAYQHTSPAKAALMVRRDLLDGKITGPVAEQIKYIPISLHEAFAKARIRAVHDVGPGLCFHDFSQMPCSRFLQCTASCDDFHWRSDDAGRIDDLKRQFAITMIARDVAEQRAAQGRGRSKDWLANSDKKVAVLRQQMREQGVADFDPNDYLSKGDVV